MWARGINSLNFPEELCRMGLRIFCPQDRNGEHLSVNCILHGPRLALGVLAPCLFQAGGCERIKEQISASPMRLWGETPRAEDRILPMAEARCCRLSEQAGCCIGVIVGFRGCKEGLTKYLRFITYVFCCLAQNVTYAEKQ